MDIPMALINGEKPWRLTQRLIGDFFHGKPVGGGVNHGKDCRQDQNGNS
jgi:hypothetical protein